MPATTTSIIHSIDLDSELAELDSGQDNDDDDIVWQPSPPHAYRPVSKCRLRLWLRGCRTLLRNHPRMAGGLGHILVVLGITAVVLLSVWRFAVIIHTLRVIGGALVGLIFRTWSAAGWIAAQLRSPSPQNISTPFDECELNHPYGASLALYRCESQNPCRTWCADYSF